MGRTEARVDLRRLRLNGIRSMLTEDPARARGIGRAAADWGIDNFSQFSSDYKKLFGKSPSAYLRSLGGKNIVACAA